MMSVCWPVGDKLKKKKKWVVIRTDDPPQRSHCYFVSFLFVVGVLFCFVLIGRYFLKSKWFNAIAGVDHAGR